ncbi:MAG: Ldh family oxidoreductase [Rhodospirillaceae bacterium]|jgi:delta1-piperideine-2-carboxylate reductase|nr:Ldh family oxidoreductase [Rhodospirillaceae bacterium]MBT3493591.1 Ldh family oxidoreductase [Rhodospirillaceae bacterium]MBT3780164.1 Ldh family oxidoreductase [Rhodospirillaceae bacterium]MBT3976930.1 Ldh family oxidoreductase [Rhodospirillaceae bacterium]MBT4169663.1 Ldh family oxidoreductase [Rhodospirillaceae bacterium]
MPETVRMTLDEVRTLATEVFVGNGMSLANAETIAGVVTAAEADGTHSHGLFRVPGYVSCVQNGRVDGRAVPEVSNAAPGLVAVDGKNGFSPPAIVAGRALAIEKAKSQGIVALGLRNSGNLNALWWDVEQFAADGLIAMAMSTTRSYVAPWGGNKALFGTDPFAFACPRQGLPPMGFDFATSASARGEIQVAAREGHAIPEGWALDSDGKATTDPKAALEGVQLPFGGHKGNALIIMVELLAAGLTGGNFCFEAEKKAADFGAVDSGPAHAGEIVILIDPAGYDGGFLQRIEGLFDAILAQEGTRIPGDRRYVARARSHEEGIDCPTVLYQQIVDMKAG